jgi:ribose 5-phosphate isomerase B
MRIAIGSDHRGFVIKSKVIDLLKRLNHEVVDAGPQSAESVDYPDIASSVASQVSSGGVERGILICGTGIGMCIAANKYPNVRAAPCHDDLTAEMSRRHNDLNVLCLSADMLGERLIDRMVEIWLKTDFEGGRHARRVEKDPRHGKEAGVSPFRARAGWFFSGFSAEIGCPRPRPAGMT